MICPGQSQHTDRAESLPLFRHTVNQWQEQANNHSESQAHSHGLGPGTERESDKPQKVVGKRGAILLD